MKIYLSTLEDILSKRVNPKEKLRSLFNYRENNTNNLWKLITNYTNLIEDDIPKILRCYYIHKAKVKYLELQKLAFKQNISFKLHIKKVI